MVEYREKLDEVFQSLADATRRDMLRRVAGREMTVGEVAAHYPLTFAAVSKHLQVLERAGLVRKKRRGRTQVVRGSPAALRAAENYLKHFEKVWEERLNRLETYLAKEKHDKQHKR